MTEFPIHIYRSKIIAGFLLMGFGGILVFWILGLCGVVYRPSSRDIVIDLAVCLFILPVTAYCVLLAFDSRPIMTLQADRIIFRGSFRPWRVSELNIDDVVSCSTEWDGSYSEASSHDLIFTVTPNCPNLLQGDRVLQRKEDRLHFDFSMAAINSHKGISLIARRLEATEEGTAPCLE